MLRRHLGVAAALALLSLGAAPPEAVLAHTDDGCAIETHCDTCLLQLRTTGIVIATFALPRLATTGEALAPAVPGRREWPAARAAATRGPPLPRTLITRLIP